MIPIANQCGNLSGATNRMKLRALRLDLLLKPQDLGLPRVAKAQYALATEPSGKPNLPIEYTATPDTQKRARFPAFGKLDR